MTVEFSASPESLVSAAERIAEGLGNGGRLLIDGRGRAVPDVHHVVVEFMHPVTVGKRALPAVAGLAGRGPSDVTMSIAYGGSRPAPDVDVALCDVAPAAAEETRWVTLPPEDVGAAKVAAVLSYHVLWELTHLFLEADGTSTSDDEQLGSLYPMLYSNAGTSARDATLASAIDSAREKIAESARVCARTLRDNEDAIEQIAAIVAASPSVFTFGNGGSSTDAADAAVAFGAGGHALTADVATITALANDVSFDVVFARQLATLGRRGDCAVGFSTSGNSPNVIEAASAARRVGMSTVGFAGYDGGAMAASGAFDVMIVVGSDSVHRIQEAQSAVVARIVAMQTA